MIWYFRFINSTFHLAYKLCIVNIPYCVCSAKGTRLADQSVGDDSEVDDSGKNITVYKYIPLYI